MFAIYGLGYVRLRIDEKYLFKCSMFILPGEGNILELGCMAANGTDQLYICEE